MVENKRIRMSVTGWAIAAWLAFCGVIDLYHWVNNETIGYFAGAVIGQALCVAVFGLPFYFDNMKLTVYGEVRTRILAFFIALDLWYLVSFNEILLTSLGSVIYWIFFSREPTFDRPAQPVAEYNEEPTWRGM